MLDQFANADNPRVHYETTGPEIWRDTDGRITHFVSAMGTTGTIMGVSRYLKEKQSGDSDRRRAAGRRLADSRVFESGPKRICRRSTMRRACRPHRIVSSGRRREITTRRLAAEEGIFCGISAGGALAIALRVAAEVENATIVFIVCDRGDRYLSTGVFPG